MYLHVFHTLYVSPPSADIGYLCVLCMTVTCNMSHFDKFMKMTKSNNLR